MEPTNQQWTLLEPLLPELPRRDDGRGRPWRSSREVLECVLWILRTGALWKDLPGRFPPYQTCHRRYQQWVKDCVLEQILETLAKDLQDRGGLDLTEAFIWSLCANRCASRILFDENGIRRVTKKGKQKDEQYTRFNKMKNYRIAYISTMLGRYPVLTIHAGKKNTKKQFGIRNRHINKIKAILDARDIKFIED